jgi:hypothetical protein
VRPCAVGEEAHAAEEVAVRDAGRDDDHFARREVLDREEPLEVLHPGRGRGLDLAAGSRPKLRLQLAAEAAQRGRGQHRLPRAADPDREVVVRAADRGGDGSGHVAVLDQLDASACCPDLLDQVVVTRPVEHDRRYVVDHPTERVRDGADVVADRLLQVDRAARLRADGHLAHVHVRQPLERARVAHGDHRHRAVAAARDDAAALERVEREVDLLPADADFRARGELLALDVRADHDGPVDRQLVERETHRGRGVRLGGLLLGAAEPARAGEGRALGHAGVALAEAEAGLVAERVAARLGLRLGHDFTSSGSAALSTSSITSPIASSMLPFSITGTSCFLARPRM